MSRIAAGSSYRLPAWYELYHFFNYVYSFCKMGVNIFQTARMYLSGARGSNWMIRSVGFSVSEVSKKVQAEYAKTLPKLSSKKV